MGNCGHQGIVTGAAAALCLKYGMMPRELGKQKLPELKTELTKFEETLPEEN